MSMAHIDITMSKFDLSMFSPAKHRHSMLQDDSIFFSALPGRSTEPELFRVSHEIWSSTHQINRQNRDNYVVMLTLKGNGWYWGECGMVKFGPGFLLSLAPNIPHRITCAPKDQVELRRVVTVGDECNGLFIEHLGRLCHAWQLQHPLAIDEIIQAMHREGKRGGMFAKEICNRYFAILMMTLHEDLSSGKRHPSRAMSSFLRIRSYLEQNFDQFISINTVAEQLEMTSEHLSRLFRRFQGESPSTYLQRLRMNKACHLLTSTDAAMHEIAQQIGYSDQFAFSKIFKRIIGMPPSEYRK